MGQYTMTSVFGTFWVFILIIGTTISTQSAEAAVSISYGKILSVQQVERPSGAGDGALIGGMLGLGFSEGDTGDAIGDAIEGAATGGILTGVVEGDRRAYRYDIQLTDGKQIRVITDQAGLRVDDCASVEQDERAVNLRQVSSAMCNPQSGANKIPAVKAEMQEDATECAEAKKQLLEAKSKEEIDKASIKVKVLCGHGD